MPPSDAPKVAVAGQAPYMEAVAALGSLWSRKSIDVVFEVFKVDNPSFEFMVDTLEFLQKSGFSGVDIWHPRVAILADATQWASSAVEAGSIDFIEFRDSDFGLPIGHSLSFLAAVRVLARSDSGFHASPVAISDGVATRGVRAALMSHGIQTTLMDGPGEPQGEGEDVAARTVGVLDLSLGIWGDDRGADEQPAAHFARLWHAERLRQVLEIATGRAVPSEASDEIEELFVGRASPDL